MKIKRAFSLIEVLVVVAVLAIIAVFVVPSFLGGSHTTDLNSTTQQLAASLRDAQNQSVGDVQSAQWGVHFSNATNSAPFYAVFTGTSYSTGAVQSVYRLPATLGFVSSTLPVGSSLDVTFSQISGVTNASASIQIYVLSQPALSSTITIAKTGQIAYSTPTTPGGSGVGPGTSGPAPQYVYVADNSHNRIEVFNTSGTYLSGFNLSGSNGYPFGIAISSAGYMYVDTTLLHYTVQILNTSGTSFGSFGSHGTGNGQFCPCSGYVAINPANGNIYVADGSGDAMYSNFRVQIFNASGTYVSQFGTSGSGNGQFGSGDPQGVAISSAGYVYVVDETNSRVEIFNASGTYVSQFGTHGSGNGQFGAPWGVAVGSNGNVYVSDDTYNRVDVFNASGTYLSQFGSGGSGNGQFASPGGIAFDINNNIYVTDTFNNRVQVFNASGTYIEQMGSAGSGLGQFGSVFGVAVH